MFSLAGYVPQPGDPGGIRQNQDGNNGHPHPGFREVRLKPRDPAPCTPPLTTHQQLMVMGETANGPSHYFGDGMRAIYVQPSKIGENEYQKWINALFRGLQCSTALPRPNTSPPAHRAPPVPVPPGRGGPRSATLRPCEQDRDSDRCWPRQDPSTQSLARRTIVTVLAHGEQVQQRSRVG